MEVAANDHPRGPGRRAPPAWMLRWDRARRRLLVLAGVSVAVVLLPALVTAEPAVLRTALSIGWIGLLVMIASLWQPPRLRRHEGWVSELRPPMDDAAERPPYALARCSCGWSSPRHREVDEAFEDARGHASVVDERVERSLG